MRTASSGVFAWRALVCPRTTRQPQARGRRPAPRCPCDAHVLHPCTAITLLPRVPSLRGVAACVQTDADGEADGTDPGLLPATWEALNEFSLDPAPGVAHYSPTLTHMAAVAVTTDFLNRLDHHEDAAGATPHVSATTAVSRRATVLDAREVACTLRGGHSVWSGCAAAQAHAPPHAHGALPPGPHGDGHHVHNHDAPDSTLLCTGAGDMCPVRGSYPVLRSYGIAVMPLRGRRGACKVGCGHQRSRLTVWCTCTAAPSLYGGRHMCKLPLLQRVCVRRRAGCEAGSAV